MAKLSLAAEEPSPFRSMSMKKVQTWSWCRAHSNKLRDLSSLAAHSPLACHAPIRYGRRVEIQPSPPCKRTSTAAQVTLLALPKANTPFKYCIPQAQTPGLQVHEGQLQHRISDASELLVEPSHILRGDAHGLQEVAPEWSIEHVPLQKAPPDPLRVSAELFLQSCDSEILNPNPEFRNHCEQSLRDMDPHL